MPRLGRSWPLLSGMNMLASGRVAAVLWHRLAARIRPSRKSPDPVDRDAAVILASGLFDSSWYLAENPDVAAAGMDPVKHYMLHGWKEGRDPSTSFVTRAYLSANPDVAAAGENPLLHYILHGKAEGRSAEATDYQLWIQRYDTLLTDDLVTLRGQVGAFRL